MSLFRRDAASGPPTKPVPDGWAETRVEPAPPPAGWAETRVDASGTPDGWSETRAQTALATRLLGDPDDYLAASPHDIGRLTGTDVRELFVSCDPAEALQQQFDHLQPEFIAVHNIGTAASRQLLLGIAEASRRTVQKLVIRRQGFGTALAALEFVDVPTTGGKLLRIYSTETETMTDADAGARAAIARTLLGFSRLGVVMVGDIAPAAMAASLQPLRDAMAAGAWRNRQLLLLPLAAASALVSHGIALGQVSGVAVRTSPQVLRPADAWSFIAASWGRGGDPVATTGAPLPEAAMPSTPAPHSLSMASAPTAPPANATLARYLRQIGDIAGMLSCCVLDISTGQAVAQAGANPDATQLALHGGQLLSAMGVASRSLGLGRMTPDAAITLGGHHLLLRGVPHHPGLALHAVLDKQTANLTLARLQLQRMDALFDHPPT